jgi:endonuclease/exonuclease/phosphatase family metal-dependent hydrolase
MSVKIMSWNVCIYYDTLVNKRDVVTACDNIMRCIKDQNPDILCLQEASKYLISRLADEKYEAVSQTITHGGICVTLVKGIQNVQKTLEYFQCGTNILINNKLNICNVHMTPGFPNQKNRDSQVQEIMSNTPHPLILIGDMNMSNAESVQQMTDVALSTGENSDTWNHSFFSNGSKIRRRYDRAYTSKDIRIISFKVIKEYQGYSDHVPIILTIEKEYDIIS